MWVGLRITVGVSGYAFLCLSKMRSNACRTFHFWNAWQPARNCTLCCAFQKCMAMHINLALPFVHICLFPNTRQPAIKKRMFCRVFWNWTAIYVTPALPFRLCSHLCTLLCVSKTHSNECTTARTKTCALPHILKTHGNTHHTYVTICLHLPVSGCRQLARKRTLWCTIWKRVTMRDSLALLFVYICMFLSEQQPAKKKKNAHFAMHIKNAQQLAKKIFALSWI